MSKIDVSNFARLIGRWKTTGQVTKDNSSLKLEGIDSYEFILSGNYILHKADVKMGNERSETFEIIEMDKSMSKFKMQYFNSKGESGSMTSTLENNEFTIDGNGIKFRGTINHESTEIKGKWYLQTENKNWTEFIDLKLIKQN